MYSSLSSCDLSSYDLFLYDLSLHVLSSAQYSSVAPADDLITRFYRRDFQTSDAKGLRQRVATINMYQVHGDRLEDISVKHKQHYQDGDLVGVTPTLHPSAITTTSYPPTSFSGSLTGGLYGAPNELFPSSSVADNSFPYDTPLSNYMNSSSANGVHKNRNNHSDNSRFNHNHGDRIGGMAIQDLAIPSLASSKPTSPKSNLPPLSDPSMLIELNAVPMDMPKTYVPLTAPNSRKSSMVDSQASSYQPGHYSSSRKGSASNLSTSSYPTIATITNNTTATSTEISAYALSGIPESSSLIVTGSATSIGGGPSSQQAALSGRTLPALPIFHRAYSNSLLSKSLVRPLIQQNIHAMYDTLPPPSQVLPSEHGSSFEGLDCRHFGSQESLRYDFDNHGEPSQFISLSGNFLSSTGDAPWGGSQ